eukprot:10400856-Alexandrium_andersonii.AAC.1
MTRAIVTVVAIVIISLPGGAPPSLDPAEKRLRCARRPVSSADSESARTTAGNAPLQSLRGRF